MALHEAPLKTPLIGRLDTLLLSDPWARWFAALVQIINKTVSGKATFAAAASVTMTLAKAQLDAEYGLLVTGNAAETFSVTDKTKTSFIIRSSNATSAATVDWLLTR